MFTTTEQILLKLSLKYEGNCLEMLRCIERKEFIEDKEYEDKINQIKSNVVFLIGNTEYPRYIGKIVFPPLVLYYYGDISLIKDFSKNLAIIGSRNCSKYGEEVTRHIVAGLNKDIVIVSGLAAGIDSVAHEAALDNGLKTVAVLGCGIETCYPLQNKKLLKRIIKEGGLVISEYPLDTEPKCDNFPMRNRLIAGFSNAILVTEAKNRSGTEITVNRGLEMGKDVLAIPYLFGADSFCNRLIKEGAHLVNSATDVNDFFN